MVISMRHTLLLCFLTISACTRISDEELAWRTGDGGPDPSDCEDAPAVWTDEDGDGYPGVAGGGDDCEDADPLSNPGAPEVCGDDVDNNCDGTIDEDVTITVFIDADMDGFGDAGFPVERCELGPGVSASATDCNDSDWKIHHCKRTLQLFIAP